MELQKNCWALYGLSNIARIENDIEKAAMLALRASMMKPDDASLAKEALNLLCNAKMYEKALNLISKLNIDIQKLGRVKLYKAYCFAYIGCLEEAEELIYKNGGIIVPDIREGEISTTELWFLIEKKKAEKQGKLFDKEKLTPPSFLDFRMDAEKKK